MASPETIAFFKRICAISDNQKCIDCGSANPQWASAKFGCFFCLECSGHHRGLGVHIDFVRSVYMDAWKESELKRMELGGNAELHRVFATHGLTNQPIDRKYVSHAALLYREQLSCRAEGRLFNEGATLQQIIAMERQAEERRAQLRASSSSAVGSTGDFNSTRPRVDSANVAWETLSKSTTDIISRAWQTTASATAQVQTQWQSGQLLESWKSGVSSVTKGITTPNPPPIGTGRHMPAIGSHTQNNDSDSSGAPLTERAKSLTTKGVSILSASISTCMETFQRPEQRSDSASDSWGSVLRRFSNGSADDGSQQQEKKDSPRDKSDLSDLFGNSRHDPLPSQTTTTTTTTTTNRTSLDDLLGTPSTSQWPTSQDTLGHGTGRQDLKSSEAALDALLSGSGPTSDLGHTSRLSSQRYSDPWTGTKDITLDLDALAVAEAEPEPAAQPPPPVDDDWAWSGVGGGSQAEWFATKAHNSAAPGNKEVATVGADWDKGW